jgi:hypothetical protein
MQKTKIKKPPALSVTAPVNCWDWPEARYVLPEKEEHWQGDDRT